MFCISNGKLLPLSDDACDLPPPDEYPDLVQFCIGDIMMSEISKRVRIIAGVDVGGFVWLFCEGKCSKLDGIYDIYSVVMIRFCDDSSCIMATTKDGLAIQIVIFNMGEEVHKEVLSKLKNPKRLSVFWALLPDGKMYPVRDSVTIRRSDNDPIIVDMAWGDCTLLLGEDQKAYAMGREDKLVGHSVGYILELFGSEPVCKIGQDTIITESGKIYHARRVVLDADKSLIATIPDPYEISQVVPLSLTSCCVLRNDGVLDIYKNQELVSSIPDIDRLEGTFNRVPRSKKGSSRLKLG